MKQIICKETDVPDQGTLQVPVFGREVHVYRSRGEIRVAANVCLHFGGPLECRDGKLVCKWHGAAFDLESGERIGGPAPVNSRLMFLSSRIEDGLVNYVWGE